MSRALSAVLAVLVLLAVAFPVAADDAKPVPQALGVDAPPVVQPTGEFFKGAGYAGPLG